MYVHSLSSSGSSCFELVNVFNILRWSTILDLIQPFLFVLASASSSLPGCCEVRDTAFVASSNCTSLFVLSPQRNTRYKIQCVIIFTCYKQAQMIILWSNLFVCSFTNPFCVIFLWLKGSSFFFFQNAFADICQLNHSFKVISDDVWGDIVPVIDVIVDVFPFPSLSLS